MHPVFYQFALGLWGILPGNYSGIAPVSDQVYAIANYEGMCWGPTLDNGRRTLTALNIPNAILQL